MKLDNSAAKAFWTCPWLYWERFENKIERKKKSDALTFGKRMHQLLEGRLHQMRDRLLPDQHLWEGYEPLLPQPPLPDLELEAEAQAMFAAYCQQYPVEPFDVIDVERYFEVPLPNSDHVYVGKFDGIVREHDTGKLCIFEHKTEKRGGKQNLPASWAVRSQVSLYIWAAEQIYHEPFDQILLDVLTRQSPAGQIGPTFPPRQHLQRTDQQKQDAVTNLIWVADQIEALKARVAWGGTIPFDSEQCVPNNWQCDFAPLHVWGRDEFTLARDFVEAEEYLTL